MKIRPKRSVAAAVICSKLTEKNCTHDCKFQIVGMEAASVFNGSKRDRDVHNLEREVCSELLQNGLGHFRQGCVMRHRPAQ